MHVNAKHIWTNQWHTLGSAYQRVSEGPQGDVWGICSNETEDSILLGSRLIERTYCLHVQRSVSPWLTDSRTWMQNAPSKCRTPLTSQRCVTSQNNGILPTQGVHFIQWTNVSVKHNNNKYKTYNVTAGLHVSTLTESSSGPHYTDPNKKWTLDRHAWLTPGSITS
jgi:hypothetical protein